MSKIEPRSGEDLLDAFARDALLHLRELTLVARRVTGDPVLAEDVVQETFLEAWKSFKNFEPGSNGRAWLYKILFRVIARSYKHRSRQEQPLNDPLLPENTLMVTPLERDPFTLQRLRAAFAKLKEPLQQVVLLADVQELRYREIATILDIPIGTVMSRLNRARKQLREQWKRRSRPVQESEVTSRGEPS